MDWTILTMLLLELNGLALLFGNLASLHHDLHIRSVVWCGHTMLRGQTLHGWHTRQASHLSLRNPFQWYLGRGSMAIW